MLMPCHLLIRKIKENLIAQFTSPVRWTQTALNMIADGARIFTEVGPGSVLAGLLRKPTVMQRYREHRDCWSLDFVGRLYAQSIGK